MSKYAIVKQLTEEKVSSTLSYEAVIFQPSQVRIGNNEGKSIAYYFLVVRVHRAELPNNIGLTLILDGVEMYLESQHCEQSSNAVDICLRVNGWQIYEVVEQIAGNLSKRPSVGAIRICHYANLGESTRIVYAEPFSVLP